MAQSWPALGTVIACDEAIPPGGTYTLIGQVKSIKGAGGGEVGKRDTTVLSSTVKTAMPTIPDNGECSFDLNYDPTDTSHKFVWASKDAPPSNGFYNWKVTFSTGATASTKVFPGFVQTISGADADGSDENLSASVTVCVSGAVVSVP